MQVLVAQSCLTLCDPKDCRPPVSSVHGILQARILPLSSPGFLPSPDSEPESPALQADSMLTSNYVWETDLQTQTAALF